MRNCKSRLPRTRLELQKLLRVKVFNLNKLLKIVEKVVQLLDKSRYLLYNLC